MDRDRPLAVKLIAAYFCLKASALILAAILAHMKLEIAPAANDLIANLVPIIRRVYANDYAILLAPIFALLEAAVGLGLWFLQKWARTLAVWALVWDVLSTVDMLSIAIPGRPFPGGEPTFAVPPYIGVELIASLIILFQLFDPSIRRAFAVRD
jgi:hypothetical protein